MDSYGYNSGSVLVEPKAIDPYGSISNCNNEKLILHSGIWQDLASKFCFFENSAGQHWLHHCPCEQCGIRRIALASNPPISPKSLSVRDELLNTEYEVHGLRDNEFAVKGTFVDNRVIPGFKYSVRYLGRCTGKVYPAPRRLVAIGQGYGKRLTFEVDNSNLDHFWSDSCPDGYGLSLIALETGEQFQLIDESGRQIGRIKVAWVAPEVVEGTTQIKDNTIFVQVSVAFKATVSLECVCDQGSHDYEDIPMSGIARMEKVGRHNAKLTKITNVTLPGYNRLQLVPISDAIAQQQRRKNRCA